MGTMWLFFFFSLTVNEAKLREGWKSCISAFLGEMCVCVYKREKRTGGKERVECVNTYLVSPQTSTTAFLCWRAETGAESWLETLQRRLVDLINVLLVVQINQETRN